MREMMMVEVVFVVGLLMPCVSRAGWSLLPPLAARGLYGHHHQGVSHLLCGGHVVDNAVGDDQEDQVLKRPAGRGGEAWAVP
jgi:hypothetical protein